MIPLNRKDHIIANQLTLEQKRTLYRDGYIIKGLLPGIRTSPSRSQGPINEHHLEVKL